MEPRPIPYTIDEFIVNIDSFPWRRAIKQLHLQHSVNPDRASWANESHILGMWRHDKETRKLPDIEPHIIIDPDGWWWKGRNWNVPRNKDFLIIMLIGNFNKGFDRLENEQLQSTFYALSYLQWKFDMPIEAVKFQREIDKSTTSPGTSIERDEFLTNLSHFSRVKHQWF